MKELETRQWRLYDLIKHNSLEEHRRTTQREIFEKVEGYHWSEDSHDHCFLIWSDINALKNSPHIRLNIIYRNYEAYIPTREEAEEQLQKDWEALAPRLIRYWNFRRKMQGEGQQVLLDTNDKVILKGSRAKEYIERFNDVHQEEPAE